MAKRLSHCRRGHPFSVSNTYIRQVNGYTMQQCKRCAAIRQKILYRRHGQSWQTKHPEWVTA